LAKVFSEHNITAVMHFAAHIEVGESVVLPHKYYHNNVVNTLVLLDAMREHGIMRFIFSSTAAVYGEPQYIPIPESHSKEPINPYGASKWMVEQVLQDYSAAYGLSSVSLRYFNAAGAHPSGLLAERHNPETHIIPLLLQVAAGHRESFTQFGDDYDTVDGSCERDFIHVVDLCKAHACALQYLEQGGVTTAFNVGTSNACSVAKVIEAARCVTGCDIQVVQAKRRIGDPARLVADATKLQEQCMWQPEMSDLPTIIKHAWSAYSRYLESTCC